MVQAVITMREHSSGNGIPAQAAALGAYTVGAGSVTNVTDNQEGTSITLKSGDAAAKRAAK